jgi:polyribonucleotide nucleotidyltransferase
VTETLCETPPVAGFETAKLKVPTGARRAAGAVAVSWVALTKVVVSVVVPALTTEDELKFVPVRVKVVSGEPA